VLIAKCSYQNAHGKMLMAKCSWQNAHGKMLMAKCSWQNAHGKMLMAKCLYSAELAFLKLFPWQQNDSISSPTAMIIGRHDIQHNNIQHYDTQH
jgi:hypothetical protein